MKKFFSFTFAFLLMISMVSLVGCNGLWDFDDDDDVTNSPINFNVKGAVNLAPNPNIRAAVDLTSKKAQPWRVLNDGTEERIGTDEFDVDSTDGSYEVKFSSFEGYFFIKIVDENNSNFEMLKLLGNLGRSDANKDNVEVNTKTTAKALVRRASGKIVDPDDILDSDITAIQTAIENAIGGDGNTASVTVSIPAKSVEITNGAELNLVIGDGPVELKATVSPSYTTDTLVWQLVSPNASIDLIDENTIKINSAGTSQVRVTAGSVSDTITINVAAKKVPVAGISVSDASVAVDSTVTLTATVSPTDATDKTVTWSSGNTAVATVNATSGVVTGKSAGTATITATANDGSGVKGTCTVTVTAAPTTTTVTFSEEIVDPAPTFAFQLTNASGGLDTSVSFSLINVLDETVVFTADSSSTGSKISFDTDNKGSLLKSFTEIEFDKVLPTGSVMKIADGDSGTIWEATVQ